MYKILSLVALLLWVISLQAQQVTTFAGTGVPGSTDGAGLSAQFNGPFIMTIDSVGNLYITEQLNHRVRKIGTGANVTTLAGTSAGFQDGSASSAQFFYPWGIVLADDGSIIIGDSENDRVRKIQNNNVTTIAGSGATGNTLGPALTATFNKPYGVVFDDTGHLYIVDRYNNQIKKLTTGGNILVVAGTGSAGLSDGPATTSTFNSPQDISIDKYGNLYVTDRDNHAIRKISPNGLVSTVAGNGTSGLLDGNGAQALFDNPHGIFSDPCGNLYVADVQNHSIRKINSSGNVTTVAGTGSAGFLNGPAGSAQFNKPWDVVKDGYGNLFITDNGNNRIRKISNPNGSTTVKSGCLGDQITLQVQPADSIIWLPSSGLSCSNCNNPTTTISGPAQYLAISYQDCEIRLDTFNITPVTSSISGSVSNITACAGFQISLHATTGDSISWSPSASLSCTGCFNPTVILTQSTQFIATVYTPCSIIKDTFSITVLPTTISGTYADSTFCLGESIELTASSGDSVNWSPPTSLSCSTCFTTLASPSQSTQYVATAYKGCDISLDTFNLTVIGSQANAGNSITIPYNGSTTLNGTGVGTYSWSPPESLSCSDCPNPIASPGSTTTYYLTVSGTNGCLAKDSVTVFVEKDCSALILPTAFSPNNDGLNDSYLPLGDLEQFQSIRIYNRWGEFIFESSDAADGWDGTFKGEPQPAGVYAYILQYSCKNESFMKSGNITLIR